MIDKLTLISFVISTGFIICAIVTDKAMFLLIAFTLILLNYSREQAECKKLKRIIKRHKANESRRDGRNF